MFGLPLALIYRRLGLLSWLAYISGGLLCGFITAIALLLVSNHNAFVAQLNGLAFFVILYGLAGGLCFRAILFGFGRADAVAVSRRSQPTKHKYNWAFWTLVVILPVSPPIWLFAVTHPDGIPSGPESVIISLSAFAISFAVPLYIGTTMFGLLLVLTLRRFRVQSYLVYFVGGAANSFGILVLLLILSRSAEARMTLYDALVFVAGYGALSATALYFSTRSEKPA